MAFKFKPDKIKYLSEISTLDSSHSEIVDTINKKKNELPKKEKRIEKLNNKLNELNPSDPNYLNIRTNILEELDKLKEEVNESANYMDDIEYFGKTYDILFDYYDIYDTNQKTTQKQDVNTTESDNTNNIESSSNDLVSHDIFESDKLDLLNKLSKAKRKQKRVARKRIKDIESLNYQVNDIFNYIGGNINEENKNLINENPKLNKAELYDAYKIVLDGKIYQKEISRICSLCNVEKIFVQNEGFYACKNCGDVEHCIIETEVTNYKDPMIEKPIFPYKRKNHFRELIVIKLLIKVYIKSIC